MTPFPSFSRLALAACVAAPLLPAAAGAAETRFVASTGNNDNACTLTAPCRTLQRGVNQTPAGGELIVLDSADYGNSLGIGRSITISADGVTATLTNPGGITINDANAVVVLRGLHLKGAGEAGVSGILVQSAAAVHIERCTIESFASRGIFFSADNAELFLTDSNIRDNGSNGLQFNGTNATLTIDNSRFDNNGATGIAVGEGQATITRSMSSGNVSTGIQQNTGRMNVTLTTAANNGSNGYLVNGGQITLESSLASGNGTGLRVNSFSTARVSRSVFTDNDTGIRNAGGTVQTFQDNILLGNGTNLQNSGTITTPVPF